MGTPEYVAVEEYFTPPTLTEMLENSDTFFYSDQLATAKKVFKEWLRIVSLVDLTCLTLRTDIIESARTLLITLVDEP